MRRQRAGVSGMRGVQLATAAILAVGPGAAIAETDVAPLRLPCFSHAEVARQLKGTYAEAPVSLGLQANGNLLQVFSSSEGGTWTIVSTSPDGMACVLAAGRDWERVRPASLDPAA